jgi:hypothetical protein
MTGWLESEPKLAPPQFSGWLRAVPRGLALIAVVFGGLALLLPLRLIERPLCGMARPITPFVAQGVCRLALLIMRLRRSVRGPRDRKRRRRWHRQWGQRGQRPRLQQQRAGRRRCGFCVWPTDGSGGRDGGAARRDGSDNGAAAGRVLATWLDG